jgi:membrane protease YdiL (CAAX protease family)
MILYEMNLYDHVVAGIICLLAPLLAFSSRQISQEEIRLESQDKIRLYHSNGLLLIIFALVVVTLWRIPDRPLSAIGFDLISWHPWIVPVVFSIFFLYALDFFLLYGNRKRREKTIEKRQLKLAFIPAYKKELIHFCFLAVTASIGEEVIFRGFLINYLISWTGAATLGLAVASIFSSALFAFLHGYQGIPSMIKIFFLSLLFCLLFLLTGSLIMVIVIHAIIDLMSGFIGIYMLKQVPEDQD